MAKNMKRIHSVTLKRIFDESPDTSWLGEYSNRVTSEYSIDRKHSLDCRVNLETLDDVEDHCSCNGGDMARNEYRYFNPSDNYKGEPAEDVRKYVRQDYERMERLQRGDWCFMGVRADAVYSVGNGHAVLQDCTSGWLWGIESDSGDYFEEVEAEQLSELRDQLHAIGFSTRAISAAFKTVVRGGDAV